MLHDGLIHNVTWDDSFRSFSSDFTVTRYDRRGYEALQDYDVERAITLFKLNVLAFPDAWNTYDSLAEAYLSRGDRELAIEYYEKSLELNPDNVNATEILKQLKR